LRNELQLRLGSHQAIPRWPGGFAGDGGTNERSCDDKSGGIRKLGECGESTAATNDEHTAHGRMCGQ